MTVTENDRFFKYQKTIPKAAFAIRCKKRKRLYHYISVTYSIFFNILRKKACFLVRIFVSLHRQSKEQPSCAKSRSSMKTEAGLNRWQALVINEDHKMGRNKISVTNKTTTALWKKRNFQQSCQKEETEPRDGFCIVHGLAPEVPSTSI